MTHFGSVLRRIFQYALDRWLEERSDAVGATVAFIVGLLALTGGISPGTTGFLVSIGLEFISRILYVVRAINQNELNCELSYTKSSSCV